MSAKPHYTAKSGNDLDLPADLRELMNQANAVIERMEAHYGRRSVNWTEAESAEWMADLYQMIADQSRIQNLMERHPQAVLIRSSNRTIGARPRKMTSVTSRKVH